MVGSKFARSAEIERGDRDHDKGEPHRHRKDAADIDAHELRDFEDRPTWRGRRGRSACGRRCRLRSTITAIADSSVNKRHDADRDAAAERDRGGFDRAGAQALAVGGENLQQPVLDDDGETEGDEQRRQQIAPERPVQQHVLKRKADDEQDRHRHQHRDERIEPELARDRRESRRRRAR